VSRSLSDVGRSPVHLGAPSCRPFNDPAITRIELGIFFYFALGPHPQRLCLARPRALGDGCNVLSLDALAPLRTASTTGHYHRASVPTCPTCPSSPSRPSCPGLASLASSHLNQPEPRLPVLHQSLDGRRRRRRRVDPRRRLALREIEEIAI